MDDYPSAFRNFTSVHQSPFITYSLLGVASIGLAVSTLVLSVLGGGFYGAATLPQDWMFGALGSFLEGALMGWNIGIWLALVTAAVTPFTYATAAFVT